ncbi:MAG TPA: SDR family oxidoreductase, partial [Verrucomicrobiae bacterium]|nr:SDR family oxidoreductase [Verrucomicrobiae bacterium]
MTKTAVVTGAGSGVGQAVALALARLDWRVALLGRHRESLQRTVKEAGKYSGNMLIVPCDIAKADEVEKMGRTVLKEFKTVEVLVNAAGTNTPKRSLAEL